MSTSQIGKQVGPWAVAVAFTGAWLYYDKHQKDKAATIRPKAEEYSAAEQERLNRYASPLQSPVVCAHHSVPHTKLLFSAGKPPRGASSCPFLVAMQPTP